MAWDWGRSPEGELEKPVDTTAWYVPAVIELAGDGLEWNLLRRPEKNSRQLVDEALLTGDLEAAEKALTRPPRPERGEWTRSGPKFLEAFLKLADAEPSAVLAYARRWGILTLPTAGSDLPPKMGSEPLSEWHSRARQAVAMLRAAEALNAGKPIPEDADRLLLFDPSLLPFDVPPEIAARRGLIMTLESWLKKANVRLGLQWGKPGPEAVIRADSLLGALAIQLLLAISQRAALVTCSGCGRFYFPKKRPQSGKRHYCDECGRTAALRDAQRERRRRIRQKGNNDNG